MAKFIGPNFASVWDQKRLDLELHLKGKKTHFFSQCLEMSAKQFFCKQTTFSLSQQNYFKINACLDVTK